MKDYPSIQSAGYLLAHATGYLDAARRGGIRLFRQSVKASTSAETGAASCWT
jgi:hypothetical protein